MNAHTPISPRTTVSAEKPGLAQCPDTAAESVGSNLDWAHKPSPFAWSVMIYGGQNPRTGLDLPQMEVQFHKRTRPSGYGLSRVGILQRARDFAEREHRTHFAVRDSDGSVIFAGPASARLTDTQLVALSADQRRFARGNK